MTSALQKKAGVEMLGEILHESFVTAGHGPTELCVWLAEFRMHCEIPRTHIRVELYWGDRRRHLATGYLAPLLERGTFWLHPGTFVRLVNEWPDYGKTRGGGSA